MKEISAVHKNVKVIKVIAFLIILTIVIGQLNSVFGKSGIYRETAERFNRFYNERPESIDVLYFGSSSVFCYFIPEMLYYHTGIASYPIATPGESFAITRYMIENALNYQSPQLIVIDLNGARLEPSEDRFNLGYDALDVFPPYSILKLRAIRSHLDYNEAYVDENGKLSIYFPFMRFHSRWENLSRHDFQKISSDGLGYYESNEIYEIEPQEPTNFSSQILAPDSKTQDALTELLDYCDTLNVKILFIAAPTHNFVAEYEKINYAVHQVESRGYKAINFNTDAMYEEVGLKPETDWFNATHVNINGAIKYTAYFSTYFSENYNLPDRREEQLYASWDDALDAFYMSARRNWLPQFDEKNLPFYAVDCNGTVGLDVMPPEGELFQRCIDTQDGRVVLPTGESWSILCDKPAGLYTYEYTGENLDKADFAVCVERWQTVFDIFNIEKTNTYCRFDVIIPEDTRAVHSGLINHSDEDIVVTSVRLWQKAI